MVKMKKWSIILFSSLLLVACSNDTKDLSDISGDSTNDTNASSEQAENEQNNSTQDEADKPSDENQTDESPAESEAADSFQSMEEYKQISELIDVDKYQAIIETDNRNNRVILFENDQKEKQYKSIFVKADKHLKLLDINNNEKPLYNDFLANEGKEVHVDKKSELESFEEYATLNDTIDLSKYSSIVESDNKGSRVIIFKDENEKKVYKSVYTKNNQRLKIIQLTDDQLLFNEVI